MLIFSTKLMVNSTLTKDVFIGMIVDWLSNNRNYKFGKIVYDGSNEFIINKETDSLEIADYSEALTVRLVSVCDGVIWTNDYVLTKVDGKDILAIQLYSDASNMSVKLPDRFNKPRVLGVVVQKGYGGMDYDIPVSDLPCTISKENIDIACKLIGRESTYFMPVIYVSYPRYAIDAPIDFTSMAKNLSGIAHVVVESKEIASSVRRATNGRNPYAGAVDIFYGKNSSYRVIPDNFESLDKMQRFIEKSVQQKILMTRIEDEFSWMKIHFSHLQSQNREAPELMSLYEQLLKEADAESELKKQHIDELEYQNMELEEKIKDLNAVLANKESQLQTYQHSFKQTERNGAFSNINIATTEKELYTDEILDVILKVLEKERNLMDLDPNLVASRKFHVLENVLELNAQTGKADEIADCLRNIIDKSCNLNNQRKRQLVELGFNIQVGTHYKIVYNGEERYAITLSKTAGDYRSNTNTLKDAINMLFGR